MAEKISIVVVGNSDEAISNILECLGRLKDETAAADVAVGFRQGEELLSRREPMVVITDMCSQGIDPCLSWTESIARSFPRTAIFAIGDDSSYEVIRKFMGAGATEYFTKPVSEADLSAALQKIGRMRALPESEGSGGGKIYTICSAKNGVGVTTMAVNLAASIYEVTKEPTIIVDLDLIGGDVGTFLKLKPSYTISDAARYIGRRDKSFLSGIITMHSSGIYVLGGPNDLEEGISISGETAGKILDLLRNTYKHVIVDTEANLTQTTMTAIDKSDIILLTFILSLPGIKNTLRYLNYLERDSLRSNKIQLIVNRYFEKLEIKIGTAENLLHRPVFWSIPNDFKTAMSCLDKGVPLGVSAPQSKLNLSIRGLAMALTGKQADAPLTGAKKSPLNRLFRNPKH